MNIGANDPNAPLDTLRTRLEFSGSIRANAFTGSLDGFATSGSIVQVWSTPETYGSTSGQYMGYIPPNWAKRVTVICVGAGGGGGAGASQFPTLGTWRSGGGGGAGGSVTVSSFEVSDMIAGTTTIAQRTWTIFVPNRAPGGTVSQTQTAAGGNGDPGGAAGFYNSTKKAFSVFAAGGAGGRGAPSPSTNGALQPYVAGGDVRGITSPNHYLGGPGGQGVSTRNITAGAIQAERWALLPNGSSSGVSFDAASLPYSGSLPNNNSFQIPSAIAPTGGGGGGGFARTFIGQGNSPRGGNAGGVLKQNPTSGTGQNVVPGVVYENVVNNNTANNQTQAGTNNQHVFWNNIRMGLGGQGGVPGHSFPQVGGFPGGGGGGGGGGLGAGQNGTSGGSGMVIVITEH